MKWKILFRSLDQYPFKNETIRGVSIFFLTQLKKYKLFPKLDIIENPNRVLFFFGNGETNMEMYSSGYPFCIQVNPNSSIELLFEKGVGCYDVSNKIQLDQLKKYILFIKEELKTFGLEE